MLADLRGGDRAPAAPHGRARAAPASLRRQGRPRQGAAGRRRGGRAAAHAARPQALRAARAVARRARPVAPARGRCSAGCADEPVAAPARRPLTRRGRAAAGAVAGRAARGPARRARAARRGGRRPARAAARRRRRAPVPPRQRRPLDDRRPRARPRGARARAARVWVVDEEGRHAGADDATLGGALAQLLRAAREAPVRLGLDGWDGADVAVATGWQTVPAALLLPGVARARLPRPGPRARVLPRVGRARVGGRGPTARACTASPRRRGWPAARASATARGADHFDLGVDHETYHPLPTHGAGAISCSSTPARSRRAAPCRSALLALEELHRRRPEVEVALFGEARPIRTPFPHRTLGVLEPRRARAGLRTRRPSGLVLSHDEPVARPDRDARLRPARRRPRRAESMRDDVRRPTARSRSPLRPPRDRLSPRSPHRRPPPPRGPLPAGPGDGRRAALGGGE